MLMATATAVDGMPQIPVAGNVRVALAASAGAPDAPIALRVSATRQGDTV